MRQAKPGQPAAANPAELIRSAYPTGRASALDSLLPKFSFRHTHAIRIDSGDQDRVMEIARDIPLGRSTILAGLFKLRGLPAPVGGGRSFIRAMGWTDLSGELASECVVGYVRGGLKLKVIDGADFVGASGRQKVAFALRATTISPDIVEVSTETRVLCSTKWQTLRFGCYWFLIRPFSGLVRMEMLRLIKEAAEEAWQASAPERVGRENTR